MLAELTMQAFRNFGSIQMETQKSETVRPRDQEIPSGPHPGPHSSSLPGQSHLYLAERAGQLFPGLSDYLLHNHHFL